MSDGNASFAALLGGEQRGSIHDWRMPPAEPHWLHLELTHEAEAWLLNKSRIDPVAFRALVAMGARPRCAAFDDGVLVVLRGVNTNEGSEPEDMVSLRMWIEKNRVVTVAPRPVSAIGDLHNRVSHGRGPGTPAELVVDLAGRMLDRMTPIVAELEEETDILSEILLGGELVRFREGLAKLRRRLIQFRRHLSPQRDTLKALLREGHIVFGEQDRELLREVAERTTKYVEDISSMSERGTVMHDELEGRLNERMNRNMQTMSLVAALFLPVSFLSSLFGMNVGGIPLGNSEWGFLLLCAIMALLMAGQIHVMRRLKLFTLS
ncbi:MAG: zinc transporter ZntB [Planctomycetota bacterium]